MYEEERRRFPRYQIQQMIKIALNNIQDITDTRGINISKSGILCEVNQDLMPGTKVYLLISIPLDNERLKIEIQSEVVRSEKSTEENKYKIALNFLFIEENNKKELYKYIDRIAETYKNLS